MCFSRNQFKNLKSLNLGKLPSVKKNEGSLSGVFVMFVILTPNLLPSPIKCMGLLQYMFEEVVAE